MIVVHPARIHKLNDMANPSAGPVVYWMQRDQRVSDNWALLYARQKALELNQSLVVVFCLSPAFLGASVRHYGFMVRGLAEAESELNRYEIPFFLLHGEAGEVVPAFLQQIQAGFLVTDFNPLQLPMQWRAEVAKRVKVPFAEVDAHNVIPCRWISDKQEYAAFTLRKKVEKHLPEFLTDFPPLLIQTIPFSAIPVASVNPEVVLNSLRISHGVGEVAWIKPGEREASRAMGKFLAERLNAYDTDRNFPDKHGQSDLSPYLHFGQLPPQRLALEASRSDAEPASRASFLEELIVRRELSDNFCLYNPDYGFFDGFQPWARQTLNKHRDDPREFIYTGEQFETGSTHDPLWNAAQREMVKTGKMHGFMRMYWAKKILEWTSSPEEAMAIAIWLNDKYELDGRDPNGYAGIAWSIGGIHDRPWNERPVFGMIRFMNYAGCKRKFNVEHYIRYTKTL